MPGDINFSFCEASAQRPHDRVLTLRAVCEDAVDPETVGMLAAIGIVKGEPFEPDERMRRILGEAALVGGYMALATSDKSRLPLQRYADLQWIEIRNTGYPAYRRPNHTLLDGLSLMGWFAGPEPPPSGTSNWIRTLPGKGWFTILRLYGPLESYMDRSWKPSDVERA